jgi:hypothetical protein
MAGGHGKSLARIVSPPASAGNVDLRPCMKLPLTQGRRSRHIPTREPCCHSDMPTSLHVKNCQVTARTLPCGQGFGPRKRVTHLAHDITACGVDALGELGGEGKESAFAGLGLDLLSQLSDGVTDAVGGEVRRECCLLEQPATTTRERSTL